ncbi:MAG TPA: serine hydrolase [Thermoanaerobaculia bacterium]|nr:serine hydrolase [Thermoanaerobaculia bacterium]
MPVSLQDVAMQDHDPELARTIDAITGRYGAETLAVAFEELETGRSFFRDERVILHAASTMKVPVMLAIFEAIDRRELSLDQPVVVENRFVSIFDGSTYAIAQSDDSDTDLYASTSESKPLGELMHRMIVRSSNLATNLLIQRVGADRVMALMRSLGANDIRVLRGVEDQKAFDAGMNNTTTAYDLMLVMKAIAERKAISPAASEAMIDILRAQEFRSKIPAGLPPGVMVAHKTGNITRISHDAAIVYPPARSPYVLIVLTRGIADENAASRAIAEVSRAIWDWAAPSL